MFCSLIGQKYSIDFPYLFWPISNTYFDLHVFPILISTYFQYLGKKWMKAFSERLWSTVICINFSLILILSYMWPYPYPQLPILFHLLSFVFENRSSHLHVESLDVCIYIFHILFLVCVLYSPSPSPPLFLFMNFPQFSQVVARQPVSVPFCLLFIRPCLCCPDRGCWNTEFKINQQFFMHAKTSPLSFHRQKNW